MTAIGGGYISGVGTNVDAWPPLGGPAPVSSGMASWALAWLPILSVDLDALHPIAIHPLTHPLLRTHGHAYACYSTQPNATHTIIYMASMLSSFTITLAYKHTISISL